jgi:CubicO group peptidase (beta-lactamase class C family)
MNPDKYQQAWRSGSSQSRVTIHADLLRKEVERNQGNFLTTIFWRDFREVGIAVLMLPLWIYMGIRGSLPWTWYLTVPALLWIIGFFVVDRMRHKQSPCNASRPLTHCITTSLAQVDHQIWLLRNIFWWYLLPFTISLLAFFAQTSWQTSDNAMEFIGKILYWVVFVAVIYGFLYYVNQRAVRMELEPRRQELLTVLESLSDETNSPMENDAGTYQIVPASLSPFADDKYLTPTNVAVRAVLAVAASLAVVISLAFVSIWQVDRMTQTSYDGPPQSSGVMGDSLAKLVRDLRRQEKLVGLAAMVMVDGRLEGAATQGERKAGSGVPLQISDRWHLGGITKSVTATMIARLIESGQMKWTDTVGEAFPESSTHTDWKPVTLRQLLTDTAGAPADFPKALWTKRIPMGSERIQGRKSATLNVIAIAPEYAPGTKNAYSNVGYTIAAAMAEKATGVAWEDLVVREVFEPLDLSGAGFGPPESSDDSLPQPRGHRSMLSRKFAVDDQADNGPILGPAATVHMTLEDLCTFATEHLRGERGDGKLLSAETYKLLHTPEFNQYACGWVYSQLNGDIPPSMYWHNGSNTFWYAMVAVIPETDRVVAVTSNDGDSDAAEAAAIEIVRAHANTSYAKKSPFTAIRWKESQPEVQLENEWYELVALDAIPVIDIVDFSRQTFGERWQKRFSEDLVEVLTRMGYPPQNEVTLVLRSFATGETLTRTGVAMTEENRHLIRAANEASLND